MAVPHIAMWLLFQISTLPFLTCYIFVQTGMVYVKRMFSYSSHVGDLQAGRHQICNSNMLTGHMLSVADTTCMMRALFPWGSMTWFHDPRVNLCFVFCLMFTRVCSFLSSWNMYTVALASQGLCGSRLTWRELISSWTCGHVCGPHHDSGHWPLALYLSREQYNFTTRTTASNLRTTSH